jgi:hypothetical protein
LTSRSSLVLAFAAFAVAVAASACGANGAPDGAPDGGDVAIGAVPAAVTAKGGDCSSCHMPEYEGVRDPVHVGAKPTTCAVCHTQQSWRPVAIHHEWWPLTGAHLGIPSPQCSWCHKGTPVVFKGTPKACVGCHREDYDASTFPEHQTFPTTCGDCHTTAAGWKPAKHPPPKPVVPVVTAAPLGATGPKGTTPQKGATPSKATPSKAPATPPARPTATPPPAPTTRPPDVITRPSRRGR